MKFATIFSVKIVAVIIFNCYVCGNTKICFKCWKKDHNRVYGQLLHLDECFFEKHIELIDPGGCPIEEEDFNVIFIYKGICDICNKSVVIIYYNSCYVCKANSCEECIITCSECQFRFCPVHVKERMNQCEICKSKFCYLCSEEMDKCSIYNKSICVNCYLFKKNMGILLNKFLAPFCPI
ncbi:MAG: hypothetical protein ACTSRG_23490 [Candidatus Helarchaeota archaeon]